MRTETSRHPRNTLLLAVALSALMAQAAADPLQDCIQDKRARLRLQTCPAVIDSPAYNALEKSSAYANLGELRLQAGALKEATSDFANAIRLNGSNDRAFAGRAQARFLSRNIRGAIQDFDKAIALAPGESAYLIGRGHALLVSGEPDASIRDLDEAIRLDPRSAAAFNNRGLAYRKKNDFANALADYNEAIALNPAYALAHANRGYLFERQGRRREAVDDFTQALRLDPSQVQTRRALRRLGSIDGAERESDTRVKLGQTLVNVNCAPCHAAGARGVSPNPDAPPFRELHKRHQMMSLRAPITRAIATPHETMPAFRPSSEELDAIVAYINSLPSTR